MTSETEGWGARYRQVVMRVEPSLQCYDPLEQLRENHMERRKRTVTQVRKVGGVTELTGDSFIFFASKKLGNRLSLGFASFLEVDME